MSGVKVTKMLIYVSLALGAAGKEVRRGRGDGPRAICGPPRQPRAAICNYQTDIIPGPALFNTCGMRAMESMTE